jgi:hypothetical protein
MIDLEAIKSRHEKAQDSVHSAHRDRGVLIAEVERLRAESLEREERTARIMIEAERHRRISDEAVARLEKDDEEQAEASATWDQVEAILDGFDVGVLRPGAKRVADLLAEVERLRELLLNAGWPREADGIAELALQAERAAVVAWLRGEADAATEMRFDFRAVDLNVAAGSIERGEHREEKE